VPEGDSVFRAAERLRAALAGHQLTGADLRVPKLASVDLSGRVLEEVVPRGKHLLFRFDDGRTLRTHFRMDGSWRIYASGDRWTGGPGHTIRAVLRTASHAAVGYRLADIDLVRTRDEHVLVGHLGPDVLGPDWDRDEALARLSAVPDRGIFEALLDQRNLAGLGTIYTCEALFLSGVRPQTPVRDVPEVGHVVDIASELIRRNAARGGQVTTGEPRRPHFVHGRQGRPCRRCGTVIRAEELGDWRRVASWCPTCQC
jgi:endonuclease-8